MTAWSDVELAVEAMRSGASDFVQKPWDNARLLAVIARHAKEAAPSASSEMAIARSAQQKLFPHPTSLAGKHWRAYCSVCNTFFFYFWPVPFGTLRSARFSGVLALWLLTAPLFGY